VSVLPAETLAVVDDCWNRRHWIGRGGIAAADLPDPSRISALLERPGLHWPYLTVVQASSQPALREFTDPLPGYRQRAIDPVRVRALMDDGYTLKFQRVEDFDETIREAVAALQEYFLLAVTAYAFVTPAESQGLSFHRDASHVLVWQLSGEKVWNIVRPAHGAEPTAGLENGELDGEHIEFTLSAGDILYLPHGWPHRARTVSGRSTHLTFTLARPQPHELAAELAAGSPPGDGGRDPMDAAVERLGL
jgi:Cupin superfamily protein